MFKRSITLKPVFQPADPLVERVYLHFCEAGSLALVLNKIAFRRL